MTSESKNLNSVHAFFMTHESNAEPDVLAGFYDQDVVQEEFPNAFLPEGAQRNLDALLEASHRGRAVMSSQTFEILNAFASGEIVVVEASWTGTLSVAIGESVPAGTVMHARFAQFFEFRNGKIISQRNYDCFYPWRGAV